MYIHTASVCSIFQKLSGFEEIQYVVNSDSWYLQKNVFEGQFLASILNYIQKRSRRLLPKWMRMWSSSSCISRIVYIVQGVDKKLVDLKRPQNLYF